MRLHLNIVGWDGRELPSGGALRVEVRDASFADAPATVVESAIATVPPGTVSLALDIDAPTVPDGAIIWAHLDVDRSGRLSSGDYLTVESYPVEPAASSSMTIRLRRFD